jgi:hypothetical protein
MMTPTIIAIVLVIAAVGAVVWATRRKPARPYEERLEQDTAWKETVEPTSSSEPRS